MRITPTKNQLIELYIIQNKSVIEIAKIFGFGRTWINILLKKYEIPIRRIHIKYIANHSAFSSWSDKMAYCLGFITADGHVWKDRPFITIALNKKDEEMLSYIRDFISPESKIRYTKEVVQLNFYSEQIKTDLSKYNVTHNKTFNMKIDFDIPEEFWGDYLRGYFDGDGSIWKRTDGNSFKSSIVGASLQPFEYIKNRLGFGKTRTVRKKYFEINFSQKDTIALGKIIYKNKNGLKMMRKFDKFMLIKDFKDWYEF